MLDELDLDPEIIDWLKALDSDRYNVFVRYISLMNDEFDWIPAFVNHAGLWYKRDGWFCDEVNIDSTGAYSVYYLDNYEGKPAEERICDIFANWSAELSESGNPIPC